MTDPSPDRVPAAQLRRLTAAILEAEGMSPGDARVTADVLVWADLRGVPGHGVRRLERYLGFIAKGELDPRARPQIHDLAPSCLLCAAARGAGPVALSLAAEAAAVKATLTGAAFAVVRETTHIGAAGYYVEQLALQGLIGIAAAAGPVNMAYHGAAAAGLSTSPLAIGLPSAGAPRILDMATGALSMGGLRGMAERGEALAPGLALDPNGRPTVDAAAAAIPLPMAGAKGAGLAFMIEALSSLLASAPIVAPALQGRAPRRHTQNAFVIAVRVEVFRGLTGFEQDLDDFAAALRTLPALDAAVPIRAPGERASAAARQNTELGVPLSPKTRRLLQAWAEARGIASPAINQGAPSSD